MVEISKHLFESTCRDVHCNVILHPWNRSCWGSSLETYGNSFIGSAKFYFVIHLAQNIIKGKKIFQKHELLKIVEYYLRSTLLGGLISGSCASLGCSLRWLLGKKFTYYSYLFIPNTINGIFILLEPPSRRGLVVNLFCNLVIEYWMRTLERARFLSITKTKLTLMFMLGSSLLFYLMRLEGDRKNRTPLLWFFTPEKVKRKTKESDSVCPHNGPCLTYILKGTLAYFGIGLGFTLARIILPSIKTPLKAITRLQTRHLNMAMFLSSYIGIYRAITCYLCKRQGFDSALYALPAGYFAGMSFLFNPSLPFAIASLSGAFKLFSTILYEKKILSERYPLTVLLYCFCQGTLFHTRFMHPDVCPSYVFKLMRSVTNGRSDILYANLLQLVKEAA